MTRCDNCKDNDRNCGYDPDHKAQSFANMSCVFEAIAAWARADFRVFAACNKHIERCLCRRRRCLIVSVAQGG